VRRESSNSICKQFSAERFSWMQVYCATHREDRMMRAATVLMVDALLIACLGTTLVWAYPTTAERTADAPKATASVETPQAPRPATQIRVILPPPWESNVQATR
jgi:hypothetical protein